MKPIASLLVLALVALAPAAARAEGLRDFCAERPGSATPPCIVDVGHLMLEVDGLDVEHDRNGPESETTSVALSPHLRFGLTERLEAAVTFVPLARQRLRDREAGTRASVTGAGDAQLALKFSLKNPDGSGLSAAVLPFVSLPTAQRGLGAGGFQGGVVAPISAELPGGFNLGLSPEIDVLRNPGGGGTHANYVGVIALGHTIGPGLNGAVELGTSFDDAPGAERHMSTAGATLAWIPQGRPNLQLDLGSEFGLNRAAPDARVYVGVSRRF